MSKKLLFGLLALLLSAAAATAQDKPAPAGDPSQRKFGLGFELGVPIGIAGKGFITPEHTIAFALGYDLAVYSACATIDYLYHFWDVAPANAVLTLRPYVGGGFYVGYHFVRPGDRAKKWSEKNDYDADDYYMLFGMRTTAGISLMFRRAPVELFLDLSPGVMAVPRPYLDFAGVLGVRFYF